MPRALQLAGVRGERPTLFSTPDMDAAMGAMLANTSEMLRLAVRQHRLEQAFLPSAGPLPTSLDDPIEPPERGWVRAKADDLVSAWLTPFAGEVASRVHMADGGGNGWRAGGHGGTARASAGFHVDVHHELILAVRRYWSGALYRAVIRDAEAAQRAHGDTDLDVTGLDQALRGSLAYQAFGWIGGTPRSPSHGQRATVRRQPTADEIAAALDEAAACLPGRLPGLRADVARLLRGDRLSPMPGGIHSRCYDGVV